MLSDDELYNVLLVRIRRCGSQRGFAEAYGISPQYVNDLVKKRNRSAVAIANILGYKYVSNKWEPITQGENNNE